MPYIDWMPTGDLDRLVETERQKYRNFRRGSDWDGKDILRISNLRNDLSRFRHALSKDDVGAVWVYARSGWMEVEVLKDLMMVVPGFAASMSANERDDLFAECEALLDASEPLLRERGSNWRVNKLSWRVNKLKLNVCWSVNKLSSRVSKLTMNVCDSPTNVVNNNISRNSLLTMHSYAVHGIFVSSKNASEILKLLATF